MSRMTVSEAVARMQSVAEDCARIFDDMGLSTRIETVYFDAAFNKTDENRARHLGTGLTIMTGEGEDVLGFTLEMSAEIKNGSVDERELYTSFARFDSSVEETVGAIHRSENPRDAIIALSEEANAQYEALLKKFNIMKIGVTVVAVIAIALVILTLIF